MEYAVVFIILTSAMFNIVLYRKLMDKEEEIREWEEDFFRAVGGD